MRRGSRQGLARALAAGLAAAAAWLGLAACSGGEAASVEATGAGVAAAGELLPSAPPDGVDQAKAAQATAQCLKEAAIPAQVHTSDTGAQHIGLAGASEFMLRYPNLVEEDSQGLSGEAYSDPARLRDWRADQRKPVSLVVDGVDQTATWVRCLIETRFVGPVVPEEDRQEVAERRQAQTEATNRWAACARAAGLDAAADVEPGGPDDPFPVLSVPLATPPETLRAVLAQCPVSPGSPHEGAAVVPAPPAGPGDEHAAQALREVIEDAAAPPR